MRQRTPGARPVAKSHASAAAELLAPPRLALALSGGGDSTALLLALRSVHPEIPLIALIVDHGLRAGSAAEAETACRLAEDAGAKARILRWSDPRPGQAHARKARHRLLASAARAFGADLICFGHTQDDRIETLRMRARRAGPEARMAGPRALDPSPVWPEGRDMTIARPLLGLSRADLRNYVQLCGLSWIEDPSNDDPAYERVRLRSAPSGGAEVVALLRRSDAATRVRDALNSQAFELIGAGAGLAPWGGARLDRHLFASATPAVAAKAVESLILAASGCEQPPKPDAVMSVLSALNSGSAATCGGAHLTADGWLGRDPGAAGRADGAGRARPVRLDRDGEGVFDGRWHVRTRRPAQIDVLGARTASLAPDVPASLRPGLAAISEPGEREPYAVLGVGDCAPGGLLWASRIKTRLLPPEPPTWFDGESIAAHVRAALAKAG